MIIVVAVVIIEIGAEVGYRELMVAMEGVFVVVTIDVVVPIVELEDAFVVICIGVGFVNVVALK